MDIHITEVIFENRKWKVNAMLHVNGTYSGHIKSKETGIKYPWMRRAHNGKYIHDIPKGVPRYVIDKLKEAVEKDANDKNFTTTVNGTIPIMNKVEIRASVETRSAQRLSLYPTIKQNKLNINI